MKYQILLKALDQLCSEAPAGLNYCPNLEDQDSLNNARSKAFIHLYLKVKCGLVTFNEQFYQITDGSQDGGIDAYHIDTEKKKLLLIQSKFGSNRDNFEMKKISASDLVKMDISRVLKGEEKGSNGQEFNIKIKLFQKRWKEITDQAHYKYEVIILGNLANYNDEQIKRLIENSDYEVFNFERTYNELLFPLCSGTYYDPKEIRIKINLFNKEQSTLKQKIATGFGEFQVRIVFVPAKEIGRIMLKYKNSILKYNPRHYLSLSKNKVNQKIKESILNKTTNDFAIFNNGITMLADTFEQSETTGTKDVGQLIMTNPQIINGGQTAYTLSKVYEELDSNEEILDKKFGDKEVMLKVIVLGSGIEPNLKFIEEISNATNQQSRVEEADRRSNEKIQIELQKKIFEEFGLLYERKRGEFFNGVDKKFIAPENLIERYDFLRAYLAFKGSPGSARRSGGETLFKSNSFKKIVGDGQDFKRMVFSLIVIPHSLLWGQAKEKQLNPFFLLNKWKICAKVVIRFLE